MEEPTQKQKDNTDSPAVEPSYNTSDTPRGFCFGSESNSVEKETAPISSYKTSPRRIVVARRSSPQQVKTTDSVFGFGLNTPAPGLSFGSFPPPVTGLSFKSGDPPLTGLSFGSTKPDEEQTSFLNFTE